MESYSKNKKKATIFKLKSLLYLTNILYEKYNQVSQVFPKIKKVVLCYMKKIFLFLVIKSLVKFLHSNFRTPWIAILIVNCNDKRF